MTTYNFTIIIIAVLILIVAINLLIHAVMSKHYLMAVVFTLITGGAAFALLTHL